MTTSPLVIYDLLMLLGILEEKDDERDLKSWALAIIESGAAESSANWIDFLISMTTLWEHSLAQPTGSRYLSKILI